MEHTKEFDSPKKAQEFANSLPLYSGASVYWLGGNTWAVIWEE